MNVRLKTKTASVVLLAIWVMAGLPVDTYRTLGAGHKIALAGEQLTPNPEYESAETSVTSPLRLDSQEIKEVIDGAEGVFFTDAWWLGGTLPTDTPTEYDVFYSDHSEQAIDLGTDSSDSWFNSQALSEPLPNIPIVAGIAFVDHQWWTANLPISIPDPVVIVGPPSRYGPHPGVIRIRNVSQQGFEMRFQEWIYLDSWHTLEHTSFMMLPKGRGTLPDGSEWEIGTFSLDDTGKWAGQLFDQAFAGKPVLFLTIQTYNGNHPVVVRARDVTARGFEAALFEEEGLMDGHYVERIGYVAAYSPSGWGSVLTEQSEEAYVLQRLTLDERFTPVLSTNLGLEEEQSLDEEVDHIDEEVSVLAVGPIFFAQVTSFNGPDTIALRRMAPDYDAQMEWGMVRGIDQVWKRIPLAKTFTQPVVIAKPVSKRGGIDPGVVRLRNVGNKSFDLRFQEWTYLDDIHYWPERVFYLVAEAGLKWEPYLELHYEAGTIETDALARLGDWRGIYLYDAPCDDMCGLPPTFLGKPAAFAAVQTYNDSDPVTTRIRDVSYHHFYVAMDEEESKYDGHEIETVGWIALTRKSARTSDGRGVWIFDVDDGVSDMPVTVPYPQTVNRRYPVVVADVTTTDGADPVTLRYTEINESGIQMYLAEEQSLDQEMIHVPEMVSVFVAE